MRWQRLSIATAWGKFVAHFSPRGLARLEFPKRGLPSAEPPSSGRVRPPAGLKRWRRLTAQALRQALSGRRPRRLPPLDLSVGTPFQRRVWAVLRRIPAGQTWTYAQVAAAVGVPQAARAVGNACRANPVPVLVPCHRVRRIDGGLGGFSSGLRWKRWLLDREARAFGRTGRRLTSRARGLGRKAKPVGKRLAGPSNCAAGG